VRYAIGGIAISLSSGSTGVISWSGAGAAGAA
jgi:hypothetical protein